MGRRRGHQGLSRILRKVPLWSGYHQYQLPDRLPARHVARTNSQAMRQRPVAHQHPDEAKSLKDFVLPTALPGVKINTSATSNMVWTHMQLQRWNGASWDQFGDVLDAGSE